MPETTLEFRNVFWSKRFVKTQNLRISIREMAEPQLLSCTLCSIVLGTMLPLKLKDANLVHDQKVTKKFGNVKLHPLNAEAVCSVRQRVEKKKTKL